MKKTCFILPLLFALTIGNVKAQFTRYIIQLSDKGNSPYQLNNPIQFLSQRALDKRIKFNTTIDSSDLPVTPSYVDSIRSAGNVTILSTSKWFNQVCIQTTDSAALVKINNFPFVVSKSPIAARPSAASNRPATNPDTTQFSARPTDLNYGQAYNQIHLINGDFLHKHNFTGNGMLMAITDAGFYNYLGVAAFDSIRNNNQILGTWDFVANKVSVNEEYQHGSNCLSVIAGNLPGSFLGTAPKASFYLYRTEDVYSEYPIEEQNWVAALEKADSIGVDVVSVSLGYNQFSNSIFDYTYSDMNGNTTIDAKAANIAARKGLLTVAAAGNDGEDSWHYISTPGDADSVLTVGAVDTNKNVAPFSSYGPNSAGQTKPDVAGVGWNACIVDPTSGQVTYGNGTSFACPIIAGMTTCLWQAFPEVKNMDVISALQQSGDRYLNPDNRTGYGIPDAKNAFVLLMKKLHTFQSSITNCTAQLNWNVKCGDDILMTIERKLPSDNNYKSIATQTFKGSFAQKNCSYNDALSSITSGINIKYRIKINIGTDTSFYLDSTTLSYSSCSSVNTSPAIVINPNPVRDNLYITVKTANATNVTISIRNLYGQSVYTYGNLQTSINQTYTIPMQNLPSGLYFVSTIVNNQRSSKVILKR